MKDEDVKGGSITELFRYAFAGANIIPTVLLIMILLYWLVVIVGVLDFEFLDLDLDLDLEGGEQLGPFYAILAFLNIAELPVMLVLSILVLNFWILAMFGHYLPFVVGGLIHSLLLFVYFIVAVVLTRYETIPLKGLFKYSNRQSDGGAKVLKQLCVLKCDVHEGRIGQGEIETEGASLIVNVKSQDRDETFKKGETAFITTKDATKNIYYIVKFEE